MRRNLTSFLAITRSLCFRLSTREFSVSVSPVTDGIRSLRNCRPVDKVLPALLPSLLFVLVRVFFSFGRYGIFARVDADAGDGGGGG